MPAHRRFLCLCLALAALLLATAPASADRFVDPGGPTFLSIGNEMIAFGGFVYFSADDGVVGQRALADGRDRRRHHAREGLPGRHGQ